MHYDLLEAVRPDGGPLPVEEAVFRPAGAATKPLGAFATWKQALRAVARAEVRARKARPCGDLALVIVRSRRPD